MCSESFAIQQILEGLTQNEIRTTGYVLFYFECVPALFYLMYTVIIL